MRMARDIPGKDNVRARRRLLRAGHPLQYTFLPIVRQSPNYRQEQVATREPGASCYPRDRDDSSVITEVSPGASSNLRDRRAGLGLQRAVVGLPGADTDDALDVGDEDLAVSNLAGLGGLHDGLDDLIDQITPHRHLDACLGNEIDYVLRT